MNPQGKKKTNQNKKPKTLRFILEVEMAKKKFNLNKSLLFSVLTNKNLVLKTLNILHSLKQKEAMIFSLRS